MDLERKLGITINEAECKLEEDSAFEKLLQVLVGYGMNEDDAAQMIADCIDEQYELDGIREQLSSIYQEAKNNIEPVDACSELHNQLLKSGLNETDANMLAAKFLEQEAQNYIDCVTLLDAKETKNTIIH